MVKNPQLTATLTKSFLTFLLENSSFSKKIFNELQKFQNLSAYSLIARPKPNTCC
jgi:hypothetical protein